MLAKLADVPRHVWSSTVVISGRYCADKLRACTPRCGEQNGHVLLAPCVHSSLMASVIDSLVQFFLCFCTIVVTNEDSRSLD